MLESTSLKIAIAVQLCWAATGACVRDRAAALADDDRGEVSSTVILIGVMCALAVAVGAIIYTKFVGKANSIPTGN